MVPHLLEAGVDKRVVDAYRCGEAVNYGNELVVMPESIPHDVPNCCYELFIGDKPDLVFYCTDCGTIDHIHAANYDLYMLEANHTRAEIEARITDKQTRGEFAYEARAAQNHLSQEQALDWLVRNISPERWNSTEIVFLHQHTDRGKKDG